MANDRMMLKGVSITCNYPDDECEAAVPSEMTARQLGETILNLIATEPEMTSFVIFASVRQGRV